MDKETKLRIMDFFEAWDLVDFLQLSTEEVIDAFEDKMEEALEDIEEYMGIKNDGEEEEAW